MIPAFERTKIVHALDGAANLIDNDAAAAADDDDAGHGS
jgi:hypothetical protein